MENRFVVALKSDWYCGFGPKKGDICEVEAIVDGEAISGVKYKFYTLKEWPQLWNGHRIEYNTVFFRDTETHYGEWVESTLMKDAVLEETLKELAI